MAFERQAQLVAETRTAARLLDDAINYLESLQARYDVLNLETPNFAAGYFGEAREITSNDLLGAFTSLGGLTAAAAGEWAAFRAACRKVR